MRTRTAIISLTLGAMAFSTLTACTGGATDPPGFGGETGVSGGSAVGVDSMSSAGTEAPSVFATPSAADIRSLDLANSTWLYSPGGFDVPVEVTLANGEATADGGEFPIKYSLGEVIYGDVDGDGDEDAVARLNWVRNMGSEGLWYIWIADVSGAAQLKYPIAATGRCGTFVEPPVIADGAINLTEYLRIPGLDDKIPCSDPGTGLKKRTITVLSDSTGSEDGSESAGSEAGAAATMWPVQTAPVAAWGGICAGPKYPDSAPGLVDLWVSPDEASEVAAAAGPDGVIFEQKDSPLVTREGWNLVGFRVFGVKSDIGGLDMACAWAVK